MGRKKKKKPMEGELKSMKELTKNYDEFLQMHEEELNENNKEDFDKVLGKMIKSEQTDKKEER